MSKNYNDSYKYNTVEGLYSLRNIVKYIESDEIFTGGNLGRFNAAIINNLIVNIVENSFDKPYIMLDDEYYSELKHAMNENYRYIYLSDNVKNIQDVISYIF